MQNLSHTIDKNNESKIEYTKTETDNYYNNPEHNLLSKTINIKNNFKLNDFKYNIFNNQTKNKGKNISCNPIKVQLNKELRYNN